MFLQHILLQMLPHVNAHHSHPFSLVNKSEVSMHNLRLLQLNSHHTPKIWVCVFCVILILQTSTLRQREKASKSSTGLLFQSVGNWLAGPVEHSDAQIVQWNRWTARRHAWNNNCSHNTTKSKILSSLHWFILTCNFELNQAKVTRTAVVSQ